jgi:hypothetical protein
MSKAERKFRKRLSKLCEYQADAEKMLSLLERRYLPGSAASVIERRGDDADFDALDARNRDSNSNNNDNRNHSGSSDNKSRNRSGSSDATGVGGGGEPMKMLTFRKVAFLCDAFVAAGVDNAKARRGVIEELTQIRKRIDDAATAVAAATAAGGSGSSGGGGGGGGGGDAASSASSGGGSGCGGSVGSGGRSFMRESVNRGARVATSAAVKGGLKVATKAKSLFKSGKSGFKSSIFGKGRKQAGTGVADGGGVGGIDGGGVSGGGVGIDGFIEEENEPASDDE